MTFRPALSLTLFWGALLLMLPNLASAADGATCRQVSKVYFGNGVNVTRLEAEEALWPLAGLADEAGIDDAEVALAYNPTDGLLLDIVETLKQKAAEDDRFSWFVANNILGYTLRGLAIPSPIARKYAPLVATIQNAVNDALSKASGQQTAFYDSTVGEHVSQYLADISAGNRVLVVAHSQGNLYANSALGLLSAAAPAQAQFFGISAVATPAETSQRGYVTSDNDLVIGLLRTLGSTVLPSNVHVPVALDDLTGHLFLNTYINASKPARARVVSLLSQVAQAVPYPPPQSCPVPDPRGCDGPDASGKLSGVVPASATQEYALDIQEGQHVSLSAAELGDTDFLPELSVYSPTGKKAVNSSYGPDVASVEFNAQETGSYSVIVSDASNIGTLSAPFDLYYALAPGANEGCALDSGGMVTGTIDKGDLDSYTFTADAGESIVLRATDVAGGAFAPNIDVYDPSGKRAVNSGFGLDVATVTFQAPTSGTYTVVVADGSSGFAATGAYNLYFTRAPSANEGGALPSGGVVTGSIDEGDLDSYTFTANAGDSIKLRVADPAGGAFDPNFDIYDPSGARAVNTGFGLDVAAAAFRAATSGTYTVVVSDGSTGFAATGAYNLYFTRAPSANEGGALISGSVVTGTIDEGDLDSFTFDALAGQMVNVELINLSGAPLLPNFEVDDPAGRRATNTTGDQNTATATFRPATSGTYTVVVYDDSSGFAATGAYQLSFTATQ